MLLPIMKLIPEVYWPISKGCLSATIRNPLVCVYSATARETHVLSLQLVVCVPSLLLVRIMCPSLPLVHLCASAAATGRTYVPSLLLVRVKGCLVGPT